MSSVYTCPKCGAQNRSEARFCQQCGANLAADRVPLPSGSSEPAQPPGFLQRVFGFGKPAAPPPTAQPEAAAGGSGSCGRASAGASTAMRASGGRMSACPSRRGARRSALAACRRSSTARRRVRRPRASSRRARRPEPRQRPGRVGPDRASLAALLTRAWPAPAPCCGGRWRRARGSRSTRAASARCPSGW